ncbi:unnamed protein product [Durusdinium trenchii]|uniref:Uncharacterized protein n=2 Tax=Durusdinium trenchii TaxID=1381693 RepID=A0ABP0PTH2_9DINO
MGSPARALKPERSGSLRSGPCVDSIPCVLLVFSVVGTQHILQSFSLLVLALSGALGIAIVVAVPKGVLKWLTTILTASFLILASYVDTLDKPWEPPPAPTNGAAHTASVERVKRGYDQDARPWLGETLSVVLPCAFEGEYASRTVESVWKHTKKNRLKEIIVVDDGSSPKLDLHLPAPLHVTEGFDPPREQQLRGSVAVRLLRHNKTLGLIAAKKTGGNAALGDVVVFFDCHVKPRDGWEEAFLKQMHRAGDHRTMVVPTITALNPDTWEETAGSSSHACYMMWNADFTWLTHPGRDVPIMSGGLLALSKRWWEETGGYDDHMIAWGGENIDQSLRSWLCGGRIEIAEGAFVAHMWRDPNNPKTKLKYTMNTEDVMRNKARAVSAWLGPFTQKSLSFPEYEAFFNGENSIGNLSNFQILKEKLKCAEFSAYLQRFSYVYIDGGLIPEKVFQIQEESSGLCLEREVHDARSHGIVMAPCAVEGQGVVETQLWHPANRDQGQEGAPCCSGLMNWNFLQCLAGSQGGEPHTDECDISGRNPSQRFKVAEEGRSGPLLFHDGRSCLVPEIHQSADTAVTPFDAAVQNCGVRVVQRDDGVRLQADQSGANLCLTLQGEKLSMEECAEEQTQVFRLKTMEEVAKVILRKDLCLDAGQGKGVVAYFCDKENPNQAWSLFNSRLLWEDGHATYCVDFKDSLKLQSIPERWALALSPCAEKIGQRLARHDVHADGTFLLRDADVGKCLAARRGVELETPLKLSSCNDDQRFRELKSRQQVQHVSTGFCFDAGNGPPILYPCHQPKAQRKQRFQITDSGRVQMMRGWDDNGRKRFFERCLDHQPQPPARARLKNCAEVPSAVRWRRINMQVPLEWKLWQEHQPHTGGAMPLGGDMAPPA